MVTLLRADGVFADPRYPLYHVKRAGRRSDGERRRDLRPGSGGETRASPRVSTRHSTRLRIKMQLQSNLNRDKYDL